MTEFDLSQTDGLLTTTKQVRKRLDFTRDVPMDVLLECIEIAGHAPMGGNAQRNRWMIVTDPELKAELAGFYAAVGRPYLEAAGTPADDRMGRVIDSTVYLIDHLAEAPALVLPLRLDRPPSGEGFNNASGYYGSVLPGVWSFQLAARSRGLGSCWTTFHLGHEQEVAEMLGIPDSVSQVALLPVAYYTGDSFHRAPRRDAGEITFLNRWKNPAV